MGSNWKSKVAGNKLYETALQWRVSLDNTFAGQGETVLTSGLQRKTGNYLRTKKGFGLNEVIGIAAGIIIAALVVIPGLRSFAEGLMNSLETWWGNMSSEIFNQT